MSAITFLLGALVGAVMAACVLLTIGAIAKSSDFKKERDEWKRKAEAQKR